MPLLYIIWNHFCILHLFINLNVSQP
uniref:Uncharacterized protein n=1 Tax=Rhizophora mucronata TaxID=61149 RepID=A0A2P2PUX8_RHIMU